MEQDFESFKLYTRETPVQILTEDFSSHEWPISGGWGYTQDEAVVIETENGSLGVSLEYKFLEYRTYEEMIVFRPEEDRFAGFRFERKMQFLVSSGEGSNERQFDQVIMKVTCFKEKDLEMIREDLKAHNGYVGDEEGRKAHMQLRESKKITYDITGWFDITKFYGNY